MIENGAEVREVRAFVNVNVEVATDQPRAQLYVKTMTALSIPDLRQQVLGGALREIDSWQRRYRDYVELTPIHLAAEQVKAQLVSVWPPARLDAVHRLSAMHGMLRAKGGGTCYS